MDIKLLTALAVGVATLIISIGIAVRIVRSGGNFSSSIFNFSSIKRKRFVDHSKCPKVGHALEMIGRLWELQDRRLELKYISSMKEQMNIVDSAVISAISKMMAIYLKTLQDKGEGNPIETKSYQSYAVLLEIFKERWTSKLRSWVRENHFADRDRREFGDYASRKSIELYQHSTQWMNDLYFYEESVTRAELYNANLKSKPELLSKIVEALFDCRDVAINVKADINIIRIEVDEIFSHFKKTDG